MAEEIQTCGPVTICKPCAQGSADHPYFMKGPQPLLFIRFRGYALSLLSFHCFTLGPMVGCSWL